MNAAVDAAMDQRRVAWLVNAGGVLLLALAAVDAQAAQHDTAPVPQAETTPMEEMIREIQADARRSAASSGIERISDPVVAALRKTPREQFVLPRSHSLAYANHPLPIGHGQTISQPFIVAVMTEALAVQPHHRVLEIGTGSGYQAAVLSHLANAVYTIEIVPELAAKSSERLAELGYDNVHVRAGDGWRGWPEQAPFDSIIVTAVGEKIPPALLEQLADSGRLVMPLGEEGGYQELVLYHKRNGDMQRLFPVRFVPLTGGP